MTDSRNQDVEPDAYLVPRKIVDNDGRKWGDTVEAQRFPLSKDLEFAEPLFSAETIQEQIKHVVQEEMDDNDNSAWLIGRLMEVFGSDE